MNNFPSMTEEQRQELIKMAKILSSGVEGNLIANLAKVALAALTARPVGIVRIEMDWNTHRNVATLDMRGDLVAADMATGDKLFTAPPAPVLRVPDGWKLVPVEPTKEMWDAYDDAPDDIDSEWHAMLMAAPETSNEQ